MKIALALKEGSSECLVVDSAIRVPDELSDGVEVIDAAIFAWFLGERSFG